MPTFPPRRILVPHDFSDASARAWRYAQDLAERFACKVDAVFVSPYPIALEAMPSAPPLSEPDFAKLRAELEKACPDADGVHAREGDLTREVLAVAVELGAELIVMGTAGGTRLRRVFSPSRTEDLVRRSPIPVLAIHEATRLPRSILAPVNLEPYSLGALSLAGRIAAAFGARLTVFHAAPHASGAAAARRGLALARHPAGSPVVQIKVAGGAKVSAILEESSRHELVVLAVHKRGGLGETVLGTTAERILRGSLTPVLCVPSSAAPRSRRRTAGRRAARRSPRAVR